MPTAVKLGVVAVVGAVLAVLAIWWLTGSDQDQVDPAIEDAASTSADDHPPAAPTTGSSAITDVNGTWTVTGQEPEAVTDGSFAGYRINAVVSGVEITVTGRTSAVDGHITVVDGLLIAGTFEVDMTTVRSGHDERDREMRDRGYEYGQFPTATFEVTQPAAIDIDVALAGRTQVVPVTGELTLHGVTREITLGLSASIVGTTLTVTGSTTVVLADHDIDQPTGSGVARVDDEGMLELQLFLRKDAT